MPNHRLIIAAALALLAPLALSCSSGGGTAPDDDDGTPPDVVMDLAVSAFTAQSVTLSWTATGDDGATGTAARYDLRRADAPIFWTDWESATPITGLPSPAPAGSAESFTVTGLADGETNFFALRVYDDENNSAGVSNVCSATCFDDFVVSLPDAALAGAVRQALGLTAGSDILRSQLRSLDEVRAENLGITDLDGLEYAVELGFLRLSGNAIDDLAPLAGMADLAELELNGNAIADLTPLASLTGLMRLRLAENALTDVAALAGLTNLILLDLRGNPGITDIAPLAGSRTK